MGERRRAQRERTRSSRAEARARERLPGGADGRIRARSLAAVAVSVLALAALWAAPLLAHAQDGDADGASMGWFTDAQAERGREAYLEHCARCHSRDLQARSTYISLYRYPALKGTYFMDRWEGESVRTLYQVVRHTMPLDDPGSLGEETYADIVAYILQENDFPSGERELPPEREDVDRLGALVMEPAAMVQRPAPQDPPDVELEGEGEAPEPEAPPTEEAEEPEGEPPEGPGEDGPWFTEEQALRGDEQFVEHCARCHGRSLQGVGVAPSLAGGNFMARWEGEPVSELFRIASTLMPLDGQGELDPQTYADLVAYILWSNGFAAGGTELPPDFQRLQEFVIRSELAEVPEVP